MTSGRPRATSRATIAEAATELFLERGYAETTVADITQRAGVSRSSFFNYFSSKADVLWGGFDDRADAACAAMAGGAEPVATLRALVDRFAPDTLALAVTHGAAMGLSEDLETERALRVARLAHATADALRRRGEAGLAADVRAWALAGAVLAAVWAWAGRGAGGSDLGRLLEDALRHVQE